MRPARRRSWSGLDVAGVVSGQHQRMGATDDVGERVDFVVQSSRERPTACAEHPHLRKKRHAVLTAIAPIRRCCLQPAGR